MVGILDGTATATMVEHVAQCDFCRDAKHHVEILARRIATAGDDFVVDADLAARFTDLARDAEHRDPVRVKCVLTSAPRVSPIFVATNKSRHSTWLLVVACASIGVSAAGAFVLMDRHSKTAAVAARPWRGRIVEISRSGADQTGGLSVQTASGPAWETSGDAEEVEAAGGASARASAERRASAS